MLTKIVDTLDSEVSMVILMDDIEQLSVMAQTIGYIGKRRIRYEVYKDEITAYMMEMRMPYNRYLAMMRRLRYHGYTLRAETAVDIFNRMVKIDK